MSGTYEYNVHTEDGHTARLVDNDIWLAKQDVVVGAILHLDGTLGANELKRRINQLTELEMAFEIRMAARDD